MMAFAEGPAWRHAPPAPWWGCGFVALGEVRWETRMCAQSATWAGSAQRSSLASEAPLAESGVDFDEGSWVEGG